MAGSDLRVTGAGRAPATGTRGPTGSQRPLLPYTALALHRRDWRLAAGAILSRLPALATLLRGFDICVGQRRQPLRLSPGGKPHQRATRLERLNLLQMIVEFFC